ncbi:PadR family transcriptional regulator [Fructilactobacillus sp. Tb1]|uniref:PadR family transcriptional regulator n=1 Tax=Fructilactobacillus sp. Tb1 TaxID=3422304 RepID=UPI003D2AF99C
MASDVSSQMLKGILKGIMLMILEKKPNYGYGISQEMNKYGLETIPKGTIYPLLATMERQGLIKSKLKISEKGPDRKYYYVTPEGTKSKSEFIDQWHILQNTVTKLIDEGQNNEN